MKIKSRKFVLFFHFVSWGQISFGITVDLISPNIEIHVPFGFIKFGWDPHYIIEVLESENSIKYFIKGPKTFGWD